MRLRFSQEPLEYNEQTVTIILKHETEKRTMVVGIVVDAVSEVYKLSEQNIRQAPGFGSHIDSCFLKGLANVDEKLIILLDSSALLSEDELYCV